MASEGGLTRAAAENVVRHLERFWDKDEEEEKERRYFGHFMPSDTVVAKQNGKAALLPCEAKLRHPTGSH